MIRGALGDEVAASFATMSCSAMGKEFPGFDRVEANARLEQGSEYVMGCIREHCLPHFQCCMRGSGLGAGNGPGDGTGNGNRLRREAHDGGGGEGPGLEEAMGGGGGGGGAVTANEGAADPACAELFATAMAGVDGTPSFMVARQTGGNAVGLLKCYARSCHLDANGFVTDELSRGIAEAEAALQAEGAGGQGTSGTAGIVVGVASSAALAVVCMLV